MDTVGLVVAEVRIWLLEFFGLEFVGLGIGRDVRLLPEVSLGLESPIVVFELVGCVGFALTVFKLEDCVVGTCYIVNKINK